MIEELRGSFPGLKERQFSKAATIAFAPPPQAGYPYTQALSFSFGWELTLSFLLGGVVGWLTRRTAVVGLGMILPFAVAMCVEIAKDSTSHNLLPIEILIFWMPVFLVTWGGAVVGLKFRERRGAD